MDLKGSPSRAIQEHENGHKRYYHKSQRVILMVLCWILPVWLMGVWGLVLIPMLWMPLAMLLLSLQETQADAYALREVGEDSILRALGNLPDEGIYPSKHYRINKLQEALCRST